MKKIVQVLLLLLSYTLASQDYNLMIFLDAYREESAKSSDMSVTHQALTALQQRAGVVLISASIWKNIIDRKHLFTKKLQDQNSPESLLLQLYNKTNEQLRLSEYNFTAVNAILSHAWFAKEYDFLEQISQQDLADIKFNFFCYIVNLEIARWKIYKSDGIFFFVPDDIGLQVEHHLQIFDCDSLYKQAHGKIDLLAALRAFLPSDSNNRWSIYLSGHGHPESSKQKAAIAGLLLDQCKALLHFFDNNIETNLLVYSSCYAGGVHTVDPYQDLQLSYPVVVIGLLDAPIYTFGLFEGVKLPPYDQEHFLSKKDIIYGSGLNFDTTQNYEQFFAKAWQGCTDISLVETIFSLFSSSNNRCILNKIENIPLLRKAYTSCFVPLDDPLHRDYMQVVQEPCATIFMKNPLLLYTKKIDKIIIADNAMPIISMLPGTQSHAIAEIFAPSIKLSKLLRGLFLSISDAVLDKNFMINAIDCQNDLQEVLGDSQEPLRNCLLLTQQNLMPAFLHKKAQALFYFYYQNSNYLIVYNDNTIDSVMVLDDYQVEIMQKLQGYVQEQVDFQADQIGIRLNKYDTFLKNKEFQSSVAHACLAAKVCKKV